MEIIQNDLPGAARFEIKENDEILGEMVYRIEADKTLIIEHTYLAPSLRGKNFGLQLLETVGNFARKQQLKIKSECSYAAKLLEKNKENFRDILN